MGRLPGLCLLPLCPRGPLEGCREYRDVRAKGGEGLTRNPEGPARLAWGRRQLPDTAVSFMHWASPSQSRTSRVGTCRPGNPSLLPRLPLLCGEKRDPSP